MSQSFVSAAAPFVAYDAGDTDRAIALAQRALAFDPRAAEAHMCLALIRLRAGDLPAMTESLKACAQVRTGEWILDRLRQDFARHGGPALPSAIANRLGAFFRSHLGPLLPPLKPEQRRADHPFVNVVGTSYVRSFGANTALFPLFIGMGPTMLLLTEEAAALTRRKFALNMERVDPDRHTLLVVGGDAFYHVRNILKTRVEDVGHATDADYELMRVVAARHVGILADARKTLKGRVVMLGSTPTFSALVDDLALRLNDELIPICAANDVEFLDCWAELADPQTNRLRADYSANAYPGDIHYSLATTPIFINALKTQGLLPPETSSAADFAWTSVFECDVDKAERTRIWSEPSVSPNNAVKSDKIASSHLVGRVADLVTSLAAYAAGRSLLIVNVRDGAAAVSIPQQVISGCLAVTDSEANRQAAQMTLDFFGRSDVDLYTFGEGALEAMVQSAFWAILLLIYPDTVEADEERCNAVLARTSGRGLAIVATAYPERISNLAVGERAVRNTFPISNRFIPEKWRDYTLFIVQ